MAAGPFLIVNPRSGNGTPSAEELGDEARSRGVAVHVLVEGDDLEFIARSADATSLGMAGGDGSLGLVAGVAVERGLPFVCIPFGTRNHFARDLGLDRDDPIAALAAFDSGVERRIDLARAGGRAFLNNASLGVYADLVRRREQHRRRGVALARLRALDPLAARPPAAAASPSTASRQRFACSSSATTPTRWMRSSSARANGSTRVFYTSTSSQGCFRPAGPSSSRAASSSSNPQPRAWRSPWTASRSSSTRPLRVTVEAGALRVLVPGS